MSEPTGKPCVFPGCTGVFDVDLARTDPYTGWVYDPHEPDLPVHDCRTEDEG